MTTFIPLMPVVAGDTADGKTRLRRMFRGAVESALRIESCAKAIAPYKTNGNVCGHKVLDNAKAVEALIVAAPENLQEELKVAGLSLYEKTQALDSVLRKEWNMDPQGKIDGSPSLKKLKHQKPSNPA